MTADDFNNHPKNMNLFLGLEIKTKNEWLQEYVLDTTNRWESPEELISQLCPTLL